MIQKIKIDWRNCYGIKELNQEFQFTSGKQIHLIYAPNGSMKTSFAKTMRYLSGQSKEKPCDKLHDKDKSSFILKADGLDVSKENIFVVNGDDDIDCSKSFVNFLASSELKNRYDSIYQQLSEKKELLISKLKSASLSSDCEPKNMRFIGYQIADALAFAESEGTYRLECLYERSCGAVVCRRINGEIRLLLIKNSRSAHWGFPKGHMERGETPEQTARREVLEETGIHIDIIPDFTAKSDYTIQGKVEKSVTIFLAKTEDTETIIQREEIDDYIWLGFDKALETLKFENDKAILKSARRFMDKHGIFETDD